MRLTMRSILLTVLCAGGLLSSASAQNPIHVTYLWHMHQPIYFPYESVTDTDNNNRFVYSVRGIHDERSGNYGDWPKNAVQQGANRNMPHAGVQVSFSGSLMENLNGIWGTGWREHWRWGRNGLRTSLNNPRLDLVGFAYHHSLMPLTSRESMIMQIRLHREAYADNWDTGGEYSKGFFPPESSFASHMIPALVDQGIEWVLVDNGHFDRTLSDFPWSSASSIRPNRAEHRNGTAANKNSEWTQLNNVWAPTRVAAPWSYQPHYVRYVDPWSDPANPTVQKVIAVPTGRYEGNENGRGGYGAFKPENVWGEHVAKNNDANRPMIIVAHSDGDNFGMKNADAFHGQHGFFLDMVQNNPNFAHTTVQDYLDMYPPNVNDVIHVEPGSWVGIDGGTPYYYKWVENNAQGNQHPDYWSWSVIIAAQNRVLHANDLEGNFSVNDVRWGLTDAARAWRYFLQAETSCHWYWDYDTANPWDGNATRGANLAIGEANKVINRHPGVDRVGPSIFPPQRTIWNPGGDHWGEPGNQPSDFGVWTFVDDVSGVAAVRLYWRTADWDTWTDLNQYAHELYAHTPGKNSPWTITPMTGAWYPTGKGPNVPDPLNRAMKYDATITGQDNVLINYFIEAVDSLGNTNRSEIFHVWVGEETEGGGETGPRVTFDPPNPVGCDPITIRYRKSGSPLGGGQIYIHVGRNDWQDIIMPNPAMTDDGDYWMYVYTPLEDTEQINVVFNNGAGAWDNNGGNDWHLTVTDCGEGGEPPPPPPSTVTIVPENPTGCDPITIQYSPNGRPLVGANPVYIHIGRNGWQDVILPNPAMTLEGGVWSYTYNPPPGTTNISFVFNNGAATWDNNSSLDWHIAVSGCDDEEPPPPPPTGLAITNPPSNIVVGNAVETYDLQGIAEEVEGNMSWTNSLTGASGSFAAVTPWTLPGIALGVGDNVITVAGEVPGTGGEVSVAQDHSSNYADWTDGSNEGTGFGPWSLGGFGDDAGHFLGANGFGLWSHDGGNLSEAVRPFGAALAVGQTFYVRMQNGWVWENGGSVGVALRNAGGDSLWQLFFNGGNDYYDGTDGMTDIGWTGDGVNIAFTLTGAGAYSVDVTPDGGSTRTYTGTFAGGPITELRAWSYNNGTDDGQNSNRDYFVNNLSITEPGSAEPTPVSDTVTITRLADDDDTDSNGDGVPDWWYIDNDIDPTTPDQAAQKGANGHSYGDSFKLGLDPNDPNSVFKFDALGFVGSDLRMTWGAMDGRRYVIQHTPSLDQPFEDMLDGQADIPVNGGNRGQRHSNVDDLQGTGFFRIRFHEMLE